MTDKDLARGLLQCIAYLYGILTAVFPDEFDLVAGPLKEAFMSTGPPEPWSGDLTEDVQPLMCHSHNDY